MSKIIYLFSGMNGNWREKKNGKKVKAQRDQEIVEQNDAMLMWPKATICSTCAFMCVSVHLIWFKDAEHWYKIDSTKQRRKKRSVTDSIYHNITIAIATKTVFTIIFASFIPCAMSSEWVSERRIDERPKQNKIDENALDYY